MVDVIDVLHLQRNFSHQHHHILCHKHKLPSLSPEMVFSSASCLVDASLVVSSVAPSGKPSSHDGRPCGADDEAGRVESIEATGFGVGVDSKVPTVARRRSSRTWCGLAAEDWQLRTLSDDWLRFDIS